MLNSTATPSSGQAVPGGIEPESIFMTTHYLDEAERLCDRLAIMDKGRIVACDTLANLLSPTGESILEVRGGRRQ